MQQELSLKDRLQPALLDRLIDDERLLTIFRVTPDPARMQKLGITEQSIDRVRRNAQRTGDLHVGLLPDYGCAAIEQGDGLLSVEPALELFNSNDWNGD